MSIQWGSDTPISSPVPHSDLSSVEHVSLDGMAFTPAGLTFDLTWTEYERIFSSGSSRSKSCEAGMNKARASSFAGVASGAASSAVSSTKSAHDRP